MKSTVCTVEGRPVETVAELRKWLEPLTEETSISVDLELAPRGETPSQLAPATNMSQADPWAHRSEGMLCKTCMWFVEKKGTELGRMILGRCRRHAPTMSGYPVCFSNDWCGDHKLSEIKERS